MKKLIISILVPGLLLAYQPVNPPQVYLEAPRVTLQPQQVFWPVVIVGAIAVGGAGWAGIKIWNKIMDIQEHRLTNAPVDEIQFTWAEDEYPQ